MGSPRKNETTTLFRPVGPKELKLIEQSGFTEFPPRLEVKTVGSSIHQEYWIPAGDLPEFNRNIVGKIEVAAEFIGPTP